MVDIDRITYRSIQRFFLRFLVGVYLATVGLLLPLHLFKMIDMTSMFIIVLIIVPVSLFLYDEICFWIQHRNASC